MSDQKKKSDFSFYRLLFQVINIVLSVWCFMGIIKRMVEANCIHGASLRSQWQVEKTITHVFKRQMRKVSESYFVLYFAEYIHRSFITPLWWWCFLLPGIHFPSQLGHFFAPINHIWYPSPPFWRGSLSQCGVAVLVVETGVHCVVVDRMKEPRDQGSNPSLAMETYWTAGR